MYKEIIVNISGLKVCLQQTTSELGVKI